MIRSRRLFAALAVVAALFVVPITTTFAHEHREIGPFTFTVGFANEPAFEGEQNGVWLRVVDTASTQPVAGAENTLKVRVIKGAEQRDLPLEAAFGEKGVYTADFYPTESGDYTFHFTGTINDTPIDERFTSSPETFSSVAAVSELQFPTRLASNTEMSAQLAAAQSSARTALIVGGVGLAFGLIGLIVALLALRSRRAATPVRESSAVRS